MNEIIKYTDGEIELKVSIDRETIWLIAEDIASLFGVQRPAIVKHIGNIYKDEELNQISTCSILEQVAKDGKARKINYYNLDIVISVGYRVNSKKATKFRQWATTVLKEYITNGYVVNTHKITEQRLLSLENDMQILKSNINTPKQNHIFYDGQIFDAYLFVSDIIKSAKVSIKLIDNYVDESTLILFTKRALHVKTFIYTKTISKQLELDLQKHNAQYQKIEIKKFELSHDRFLIIDEKEVYHFGASLKDLGKKWFAVSKMDVDSLNIIEKLK